MSPSASPDFDFAHRVERVTNISPASDAFVLFTLFTLFFTLACFAVWMWAIWRKGRQSRAGEPPETAPGRLDAEPVARLPDNSGDEDDAPTAPWEKPADWWKR